jgi:glucose-6-phosphate 1-dehydrogenase
MVIFGITGDLSKRLLLPALCNLADQKLLPDQFAIAGVATSEFSEEQFREHLTQEVTQIMGAGANPESIGWVISRVHYISSSFDSPSGWDKLSSLLTQFDRDRGTGGNYLFYLATAPRFFLDLVQRLTAAGLLREEEDHWRRVVIEKPFGHDLESARELNQQLLKLVHDDQIYRIDHYLGKETVQNLMVFRFANGIFEPIWNRRYVDHVQITVAESLGVERRGRYYDGTGALRDMVPNHLAQLLALMAMEPPSSFSATAVQNEQIKALESVPPIRPDECAGCVVRGQYARGAAGGISVPGYRQEPLIDPGSRTETYVALKMAVDTWRWADVPFYIRTGKSLRTQYTEIVVQFRNAPLALFRRSGASLPQPNTLVIGIQPQEKIVLRFEGKVPGPLIQTAPVEMTFDYRERFGAKNRTGYETLLYDAMVGDRSLFKSAAMIEAGWAIIQPVLGAWAAGRGGPLYEYPAGSGGPAAADELIQRDGREWATA